MALMTGMSISETEFMDPACFVLTVHAVGGVGNVFLPHTMFSYPTYQINGRFTA